MKYVSFYWTRPVPRVLEDLPASPNAAAAKSRTVRYQQELAKEFVRNSHGDLVAEFVFLEVKGKRSGDYIVDSLGSVEKACLKNHATLIYIDFWSESHWRRHNRLIDALNDMADKDIKMIPLPPDCIKIDGKSFDPFDHFRHWDSTITADNKQRRIKAEQAMRSLAKRHPPVPGRYAEIAHSLNSDGVGTISGRGHWRPDNVRAFMQRKDIK